MNQYNNKCEVLSSKDIKLYSSPFPIHPIIFLKNSNYAKKIKMYETDYQNNVNLDLDPSSASAGIIIAGTILSAVPGLTIPGAIIISFGTLLPILWPGGANDISIFNAMINNMETILNERINEVEKQRAFATLEGFRLLVQNYEDALIYWNDLRQRQPPPPLHVLEAAASTLRIRFELANGSFDQNLPQLQLEDYKLLLLPTYAQAANMHLNLLHQGAQLADQWNADARRASQKEFEDKPGTSSGWYQKLIEKTPKYCNYCANTYRDGLNMLKKEPNITWDRFNTYRREMTLNVLDIASLFCNYDIYKYPIGYKSEITREVYQSLNSENNVYEHYYDIDQLDYLLTRTPNLFTCLQGLYFYQQNRDTPNNFFTSHFNTFHYINDSSIQNSAVFGDQHPTDILISLQLATDIYVFLLNVTSLDNEHLDKHNNISNIHFFITNGVRLLEKHLKAGPGEITDPINKNTFGLPPIRKAPIPNYDNYSHILSFVKSINPISPHKTQVYSFAWTHISVNPDNKIYKDKTTSLPVVKANEINLPSKVIEGPGHTGGDVIQLQPQGSFKMTCRTESAEQKYFIRIRYASNGWVTAKPMINLIIIKGESLAMQLNQTFAHTNYQELQYQEFGYLEFPNEVTLPANQTIFLIFNRWDSFSNSALIIDKVEFLPITSSLQESREREKIEFAQMKVSSFFTNHTKNILQADVTDYEIDQTATLIESLTEEVYPQEKLMLLHEIKHAKQLSQSRNLLQNGDFTSLLGWTTSKDITIQTGNSDFKGYSLHMTGARTTGLSSSIFPTYIYQKIQEVTLKPYTRYRIRGFVKQSKNMEIFISRYEQEHHVTLDVENHLGSINPYVQSNIGETQAIPFNNINNRISGDFQESLCKENIASFVQDSHTFSYTLDTGELDLSETPGMELMFQISNPDGFAILGNLEVIEERLLTSEEIQQIHEKENRWKKRKQEQQKEVETSYSQAQQAITQLFANTQFSMLKWETTLQDITMANHLLDRIPNVYHRWLPDKPGSNHSLFIQLKDHISKAYVLYYSRNTIQNGDFSAGFKYWSASRDAKINETDDKSILFIPSWSTQVSQQLHVKPNSQYLLRVRGKKEGKGNGYIKISDVGNHVETLTFPSSDNHTNQMYNESEGFITKTLSIRPYTDQLRIDIGETEGTFMIESIELLHIKV